MSGLNLDCLAAALQAAHAVTWGRRAPPMDTGGYRRLAEEVVRQYEAIHNTQHRPDGLEQAGLRPIGHLCDALRRAYSDVHRATFVLQRAGVDVTQINTEQPVAKLWTEALVYARDRRQIDRIVEVALADQAVRAHHERIRAAIDSE